MNIHNCPRCSHANEPRHSVPHATHRDDWYICASCGHAYRTLSDCTGAGRVVTCQSPDYRQKSEAQSALKFPSPCCGCDGRIKMTMRERDGLWRRHECRSCETPYYSRVNDDGVTIQRFKISKRAA